MDKRRLNRLKPIKMPPGLYKDFLNDRGTVQKKTRYKHVRPEQVTVYEHYKYMVAEEEEDILKVALWHRQSVALKQMEPDYTIFIDAAAGEWITKAQDGRWLTGVINKLKMFTDEGEIFGAKRWASEQTEKTVRECLGLKDGAWAAVENWQLQVKRNLEKKKCITELQQIDAFMESVPEPPLNFNNNWLIRTAYADDTWIVYRPGKKHVEGICTRCQKEVTIKIKPIHNSSATCPHCRQRATLKSFGKQTKLKASRYVGVLQRTMGDELCLSVFETELVYTKDTEYREPNIRRGRTFRFRMDDRFLISEEFEYWEYKTTGVVRWCHARDHGMGYAAWRASDRCKLYEGNLKSVLKETDLQYIPIDKMFKPKGEVYVSSALRSLASYKITIEKLAKVGMIEAAWGVSEQVWRYTDLREINVEGHRLREVLRLDGERTNQAVRLHADLHELRVLQASMVAGKVLKDEWVKRLGEMCRRYDSTRIGLIIDRGNVESYIKYVAKIAKDMGVNLQQATNDYEDFASQLVALEIQMTKTNRFPKDFQKVHADLSRAIEAQKKTSQKREDAKMTAMLREQVKTIRELYEAPSERFKIVWPIRREEFVTEGQLQHNCVAQYFEKAAKGKTIVFFLRKVEAPEEPYCTVEFRNGHLVQCREIYNRNAEEEAQKYMKEIETHYRHRVRERAQLEAAV